MRHEFDRCRDIPLKLYVLQAELIISQLSIFKLHTDLNLSIVSETFKKKRKPPTVETERTDKTADKKNAKVY